MTPTRLYHGTSALDAAAIRTDGFRLDYPAGSDQVVWLTSDPDLAARYGEVVLEIDASLTRPLELQAGDRSRYAHDRKALAADGYDAVSVSYPAGHKLNPGGEACAIVTVDDPTRLRVVGELRSRYDVANDHWHVER